MNAKIIKAINSLEILVVTYSFNIKIWNFTVIKKKMDSKVSELITYYRMHHLRSYMHVSTSRETMLEEGKFK